MVPSHYKQLEKMPYTINGKIDYQNLSKLASNEIENNNNNINFIKSQKTEDVIASVLKQLLKLKIIDYNQNFFDMGVHSIMIIRAANMLNNLLKTNIDILTLFKNPTIKSLSGYLIREELINPQKTS